MVSLFFYAFVSTTRLFLRRLRQILLRTSSQVSELCSWVKGANGKFAVGVMKMYKSTLQGYKFALVSVQCGLLLSIKPLQMNYSNIKKTSEWLS
jgi:hypothetical protein